MGDDSVMNQFINLAGPAANVAARAGLAVRTLARRATARLLPAEALLLELSMGFAVTRTLAAITRLGIADELRDGPKTAEQIAAARNLDADTVHRVLRAVVLFDVLRMDRHGYFSLTRVGRLLCKDDPDSLAPWLMYLDSEATQKAWARVGESIRDGLPSFPAANGKSVWEWFREHPDEGAQFAAAMRRVTVTELPAIVGGYPWPDEGVICDVAGGVGPVLAGILQAHPLLTGILVDYRDVLEQADRYLKAASVRDRVQATPGDIFTGFNAKADIYILKDVLHDWDDARCVTILNTIRATAQPGAAVVVIESDQPRNEAVYPTSLVDIQMLTQCDGGRQRSVPELHELLRRAGFEPARRFALFTTSLIEGVAV